jgi:hypothetical protein
MIDAAKPLRERARKPTEGELAGIPWLAVLEPADRSRAMAPTGSVWWKAC